MAYKLFISHAWTDRWIAEQLAKRAEHEAGVSVFVSSRDSAAGDKLSEVIRRKLAEADEFVVLLTPQSVQRDWILVEIGMAFGMHKRLVALCHNVRSDDMRQRFDVLHGDFVIDLNDADTYFLGKLKQRARGMTGGT